MDINQLCKYIRTNKINFDDYLEYLKMLNGLSFDDEYNLATTLYNAMVLCISPLEEKAYVIFQQNLKHSIDCLIEIKRLSFSRK